MGQFLHSLSPRRESFLLPAAFAVLALIVYLHQLGALPLTDYDEAIYAHVVENSIMNGRLLAPTQLGLSWFEKPPLYLWFIAGSAAIFGWSEWSIRLPSALFAVLAVLLTYFLTLELTGDRQIAVAAALFLLFTYPFYAFARQSRTDAPVIATIILAALCYVRSKRDERWLSGIGIATGIGIMLKSIIGLFWVFPVAVHAALDRDWRWARNPHLWRGLLWGAVIAVPWHIYALVRYTQEFWDQYVIRIVWGHAFGRGAGTGITAANYLQHLWLYAEPMAGGLVVLFPLVVALARTSRLRHAFWASSFTVLAMLAFFLSAHFKIYPYLLPLYPFAAIAFATGIFLFIEDILRWGRTATLVVVGMLVLAAANLTYTHTLAGTNDYPYVPDEKAIGVYLRKHPEPTAIYACCRPILETIIYYGGRRVIDTTDNTLPQGPHFMIVATSLGDAEFIAHDPHFASGTKVYEGTYLSLFRVE